MAKKIVLTPVPADAGAAPTSVDVSAVIAEIRTLYFKSSARTIDRDFERAIDLLKTIPLPQDRQRATVYMEGLAEMRKEWKRKRKPR